MNNFSKLLGSPVDQMSTPEISTPEMSKTMEIDSISTGTGSELYPDNTRAKISKAGDIANTVLSGGDINMAEANHVKAVQAKDYLAKSLDYGLTTSNQLCDQSAGKRKRSRKRSRKRTRKCSHHHPKRGRSSNRRHSCKCRRSCICRKTRRRRKSYKKKRK